MEKPELLENLQEKSKRIRFHPYYYQGRKGSYYDKKGDRFLIKITKIEKNVEGLYLEFQEKKKRGTRFNQFINWREVDFDYHKIKSSTWLIKFSKQIK